MAFGGGTGLPVLLTGLTADCDDGAPGIVRKHECIFAGSHREDCRVGEEGPLKVRDRSPFQRGPSDTQALYCRQLDERGTLQPRKAPAKRPKLDEKARKLLLEDLQQRPWATHSQRAAFLFALSGVRVSEATICRTLRRISHSRKKDPEGQQNETSS